ncbi:hypothetical protein FA95DRAFT_1605147 [Auriscalpium vulgare]|uniref:Uncharacterized protein n=1 Tax=Auriscalpium vulgare TaxID=40419 RepID=A0ACB8RXF9_9AGAM|nr:hypothetical protein FA95DRAFT_1605147 [Auriscalpium vulgare]
MTLSRDRALFGTLLADARDLALRGQESKFVVYTAWGTEWKPFGQPRRKHPLHIVVLEAGVGEKIEEDARVFLARRQWYADRGRADQRGRVLVVCHASGFLNALDGVASGEKRIVFLTTNQLDELDPALIRPGRVDLAALIDDASHEQAKKLFTDFYGATMSVWMSCGVSLAWQHCR